MWTLHSNYESDRRFFGGHHEAQVVWDFKSVVTGEPKVLLGPKLEETEHLSIKSSPKPDPVSLRRSRIVACLVHHDNV